MLRNLSKKNKIIILITIIILAIAIPLTILQTQLQQDIRQRATGEMLYFSIDNCNSKADSINVPKDDIKLIALCLYNTNSNDSVNGYFITLSAGEGVTLNGQSSIIIERLGTSSIPNGSVQGISVKGIENKSGNIAIDPTISFSLGGSKGDVSVANLSYSVSAPSDSSTPASTAALTPTPTPTHTTALTEGPTPTPAPGVFDCSKNNPNIP